MSKKSSRKQAPAHPKLVSVQDELSAMRRPLPAASSEPESYSLGLDEMEGVSAAVARSAKNRTGASEAKLYMGVLSLKVLLKAHATMLVLTASGRIATALLRPTTAHEAWIKSQFGGHLANKVGKAPVRGEMVMRPHHALAYDVGEPALPPHPFAVEAKPEPMCAKAQTPTVHTFADAPSLSAFNKVRPDLNGLVQFGIGELDKAQAWDDQAKVAISSDRDVLLRAAYCARQRGYSALCSVGIWGSLSSSDDRAKAAARAIAEFRMHDPIKFRAAVELALDVGAGVRRLARDAD